ncbi:hypothetical protein METBIDRAFT_85264 [Metschnikowia bicuspidata var. bicuspidata NRRL YB-4993]|uniref:CID domain-containing protein n=1 Tax=Metschnikowia bicuspidata var. bicuspidata NRRL YB-4993 TaxID=869754 RepID=A0A1A0HFW7_9ASCO|nr:hypothetical protein METBIDRAFT_85264 [Metschnikowia bicuspidata var. bicuspidata NRRL YB-4993]OBA22896.1 hypothetical protein METBIDRAFT_85264 [Metschnikowia bicuspidata var. bicuspidata NRRL YB-4993]
MNEEAFSAEYFQHLLSSLTLNSRALIAELTSLAERFVDNAQEIVELIDERIMKILPKYKLCSFYLMDSIIKNIGNPYNLLFATNLFKNFTESYLIIDDTPTRQNLINLFKTWVTGKTSAGLDIFPKETLLKVEKFIIQATSLTSSVQHESTRITRDMVLREGNYLLQYVISLDDEFEKAIDCTKKHEKNYEILRNCRLARNNLILEINLISECTMLESRDEFDRKKDHYVQRLREIRKVFDDQGKIQHGVLQIPKEVNSTPKDDLEAETILLNLTPKRIDVLSLLGETIDHAFESAVKLWGVHRFDRPILSVDLELVNNRTALNQEPEAVSGNLAGTLGISYDAVNFQGMGPEDQVKEIALDLSGFSYEDEGDGYDPELTFDDSDNKHSPPSSATNGVFVPGKSSLKRTNRSEERAVKRVRFEV